ncbi:hypothetical protein [Neolewinella litorea]|uniref:Uncharacterized protein n=1 Tax=Neolewinella litorea TaxID=2562452 RepID=A0A4S4NMK9_9BACT|nr:hypothetical protein [Neolewinella litorea]THH41052.1 hypothetical protein E4021_00205 [Neolewinella litorea]
MPKQDSFDRQFRRTARAMRRRPAPRQWDRIEQRLDQHRRSGVYGLRPWMVAAVVVLLAGFAALTHFSPPRHASVLAQRPESVEDLSPTGDTFLRIPDYTPVDEGRADGELISRFEPRGRLTAAPKYRL